MINQVLFTNNDNTLLNISLQKTPRNYRGFMKNSIKDKYSKIMLKLASFGRVLDIINPLTGIPFCVREFLCLSEGG